MSEVLLGIAIMIVAIAFAAMIVNLNTPVFSRANRMSDRVAAIAVLALFVGMFVFGAVLALTALAFVAL